MIVDTHAHLDLKEFDSDRQEVLRRAAAAGVSVVVNPGIDLRSSQAAVGIARSCANVFAAVGIQPEAVDQYFEDEPDLKFLNPQKIRIDVRVELEKLAKSKKVVAIGECGLDYKYIREKSSEAKASEDLREKQKDIFRRQLGTAVLLGLPVIIHNREADEDILEEIKRYSDTGKLKGVFHCFTGTEPFARKILQCGFLISLTGIITYPNADSLREVIKEIPLEKIMVETDAPFLAPQDHRGERNEPAYVVDIITEIAKIKKEATETVAQITTQNARQLFKI